MQILVSYPTSFELQKSVRSNAIREFYSSNNKGVEINQERKEIVEIFIFSPIITNEIKLILSTELKYSKDWIVFFPFHLKTEILNILKQNANANKHILINQLKNVLEKEISKFFVHEVINMTNIKKDEILLDKLIIDELIYKEGDMIDAKTAISILEDAVDKNLFIKKNILSRAIISEGNLLAGEFGDIPISGNEYLDSILILIGAVTEGINKIPGDTDFLLVNIDFNISKLLLRKFTIENTDYFLFLEFNKLVQTGVVDTFSLELINKLKKAY